MTTFYDDRICITLYGVLSFKRSPDFLAFIIQVYTSVWYYSSSSVHRNVHRFKAPAAYITNIFYLFSIQIHPQYSVTFRYLPVKLFIKCASLSGKVSVSSSLHH